MPIGEGLPSSDRSPLRNGSTATRCRQQGPKEGSRGKDISKLRMPNFLDIPFKVCRNLSSGDLKAILEAIRALQECKIDLDALPLALASPLKVLTNADYVTYSETDLTKNQHRAFFSFKPPQLPVIMSRYLAHMDSHPFWALETKYFETNVVQASDIFSFRQLREFPIFKESLHPAECQQLMRGGFHINNVLIRVGARRSGKTPFGERERERMIVFLSHFRHIYSLARTRSTERLTPRERLIQGFSGLTPKQVEVAVWLAEGKSNAVIAQLLGISVEGVKYHLRAIFQGLGVEDRLSAALVAREHQPDTVFSKATTIVRPLV